MRKLIYLFLILVLLSAGFLTFAYIKLHHRPDWSSRTNQDSVNVLLKRSGKVRRSVINNLRKKEIVEVTGRDISSLILSEIRLKSPLETDKTVKAINTRISEDNITIEMVIDLNQLHRDDFSGRTYRYIEWAKRWLPENIVSALYVQFVIFPSKEGNKIDFGKHSFINVAGLDFPVAEVLDQIGIEKYFIQTDWQLQDLALKKNRLVLRD